MTSQITWVHIDGQMPGVGSPAWGMLKFRIGRCIRDAVFVNFMTPTSNALLSLLY